MKSVNSLGLKDYQLFLDSVTVYGELDFVLPFRDIEFGQWETALETLLIKMMSKDPRLVKFNTDLLIALVKEAGIICSSVIDIDTWSRFVCWASPSHQ